MCIEREKVDFKSREVNCLKECALALTIWWPCLNCITSDGCNITPGLLRKQIRQILVFFLLQS